MKRIILLTFDPASDVFYGLSELLEKHEEVEVLIPVITRGVFTETAISAVQEGGFPYKIYLDAETTMDGLDEDPNNIIVCTNPIKELLNLITPDDILAIAWDDSDEAHTVLHSLEDFGLEIWNIKDMLNPIEMDYSEDSTEDLLEAVHESLAGFVEVFAAYVTATVLDVLIDTVADRLNEQLTSKDIDLFGEDEDQ